MDLCISSDDAVRSFHYSTQISLLFFKLQKVGNTYTYTNEIIILIVSQRKKS